MVVDLTSDERTSADEKSSARPQVCVVSVPALARPHSLSVVARSLTNVAIAEAWKAGKRWREWLVGASRTGDGHTQAIFRATRCHHSASGVLTTELVVVRVPQLGGGAEDRTETLMHIGTRSLSLMLPR